MGAIVSGADLFVGAGSSYRAGYPSWDELLAELEKEARGIDGAAVDQIRESDALLRASKYRDILGEAGYYQLLQQTFAPRTPPHQPDHETLVSIPFQNVLTTNYEGVLQSAHQAVYGVPANSCDGDESHALIDLRRRPFGPPRSYVHLHGSIRRPQGVILCQEDYDRRYHREVEFSEFLRNWLLVKRLVFIGFSFNDEDFKYFLNWASAIGGRSEPRHFAFLKRPSDVHLAEVQRANLRGKHGIETVYFDSFEELWQRVAQLKDDVEAQMPRADAVDTHLRGCPLTTSPVLSKPKSGDWSNAHFGP